MPEKTREEIKPMRTRPFNLKGALAGKPFVDYTGRYRAVQCCYFDMAVKASHRLCVIWESNCKTWYTEGNMGNELAMLVTPHKELPEGVEIPKGYRLLESGEKLPHGALFRSEGALWGAARPYCDNGPAVRNTCYIVPDYSTGLWKEVTE